MVTTECQTHGTKLRPHAGCLVEHRMSQTNDHTPLTDSMEKKIVGFMVPKDSLQNPLR
jgi:hypothetical protein